MSSAVSAGRLDTRITLLQPTRTVSGGVNTVAYTSYREVWCNAKQITFRESLNSQIELQNETYTLLMRYISGITPDWAVTLKGLRYKVLTVNADKTAGTLILGVELDNTITQEPTS